MKKITALAAVTLLSASGMYAQTVYDAAKIGGKDLTGTARFVGMGGAMGALGGDVSTMGINPAGTGIYRSNDYTATVNFSTTDTKSEYGGLSLKSTNDRFNFNNIGVVFSTKVGDYTGLRYVNFGFTYNRSRMLYRNMNMEGSLGTGKDSDGNTRFNSQTIQMANQARGLHPDEMGYNDVYWDNPDVGWLSALGYQCWLINPQQDADGNYISDADGNILYSPIGLSSSPYARFFSREKGYVDEYNFNVSFNFNDRIYLGATIGAYDVDYTKFTVYDESFGNDQTFGETGYAVESWNNIYGSGFDFKLGLIVRPLEYSPLRIGLAVHTPTFYHLTLETNAYLVSDLIHTDDAGVENNLRTPVNTYDELWGNMHRKFRLYTPWKYNASLGYTIGNNLALGFEYEYQDYSYTKFYDDDGNTMRFERSTAKEMLKEVQTVRFGAEYKPIPEFAIRAGYNYTTAGFKSNAWKDLPINSISTDTDYANTKSMNTYTVGLGYRGENFYADVAYKYNRYKEDFYPYDEVALKPTNVTNDTNQVFLTLGFRF